MQFFEIRVKLKNQVTNQAKIKQTSSNNQVKSKSIKQMSKILKTVIFENMGIVIY